MPDLGAFADADMVIDEAAFVYEIVLLIVHYLYYLVQHPVARISAMWITWIGRPLASI
jgi:hypothetical protein